MAAARRSVPNGGLTRIDVQEDFAGFGGEIVRALSTLSCCTPTQFIKAHPKLGWVGLQLLHNLNMVGKGKMT